jgi:hypothetical protein
LPIKPRDFDIFVEEWHKFDADGTGFTNWQKIDHLIENLAHSDASFFSIKTNEIKDHMMR